MIGSISAGLAVRTTAKGLAAVPRYMLRTTKYNQTISCWSLALVLLHQGRSGGVDPPRAALKYGLLPGWKPLFVLA